MLNEADRKRAMRESVAIDIEAKKITRPLASKLECWNSQIAYLKGLELRSQRGRPAPDIRERLAELTIEVESAMAEFRDQLKSVPDRVLRSGRIEDVEKIFKRMKQLLLEFAD